MVESTCISGGMGSIPDLGRFCMLRSNEAHSLSDKKVEPVLRSLRAATTEPMCYNY